MKNKIKIIGAPMDLGADRRGVDMGPSVVRIAGLSAKIAALGYEVTDAGNIPVKLAETVPQEDRRAKYLPEITEASELLASAVLEIMESDSLPVVLGGDQQKYKEAATAFDNVAGSYSSFATIARYYAAMSRTHFDPAAAQTQLEALTKENSEVGFWSKIGLAETYAATAQNDKAVAAYLQLKDNSGPLPKSLILYNLGRLYERLNKNAEAIDAYFQAASADRSSAEGKKANERLNVLDPATAKKLPAEKKDDNES